MNRLWVISGCILLSAGGIAQADVPLNWQTIGPLFRDRFQSRSPDRFAEDIAEESYDLAEGFRIDPNLSISRNTDNGDWDADDAQTSMSLTQSLPFGLELSAGRNQIQTEEVLDQEAALRRTLTWSVEQQLLKGGPLFGLHDYSLASSVKERELLSAGIKFREQFFRALQAYVQAVSAEQTVVAAQKALDRAETQNAAVKSLVEAGYKAKADILVSEAAEIRAGLALEQARLDETKAGRDLARALFQRPGDESLKVQQSDFPEALIDELRDMPWPATIPEEVLAEKVLFEAGLKRELAWRDDLPSLAIGISMTRDLDDDGAEPVRSYTAALNMPLVGVITRDRSRQAALQLSSAQAQNLAALVETNDARKSIDERITTAEAAWQAASRLLALTEQTLAIEQQKYADGKTTVDQLRRTQDDVDQAALRRISRRTELLLALLEKAQRSGTLEKVIP